jgi:hypothetical protein
MKLSEAIRLGAMLKSQAFGELGDAIGTCALGAAYEARGVSFYGEMDDLPPDWYPLLVNTRECCPVCGRRDLIGSVIAECLNDAHRWTRERIADWVETMERAQEPHVPTRDSSDAAQGQAVATAVALCAPK